MAGRSRAGIVLGVGLGGFMDGIVLHQIVQWHNMGSAKVPPTTMAAMRQNMTWDGWFHVLSLAFTVAGIFMLLHEARTGRLLPRPRVLLGQILVGWAGFNLVEGVIDHHLLELHHVRDVPLHVPLYDWLFLAIGGIGLLALGYVLSRDGAGTTERAAP
jgi:uncharacterized membrane protein